MFHLVQQGDRGLFISNPDKILFPDRSWKDAKEGFAVDIKVKLDKGRYAFVTGQMIETLPISASDIKVFDGHTTYYKGDFRGSEYIFAANNGVNEIIIKVKDGEEGSKLLHYTVPAKCKDEINAFYSHSDCIPVEDVLSVICANPVDFESDFDYMMCMLQFVVSAKHGAILDKNVSVRIYDKRLLLVRQDFVHSCATYYSVYYYAPVGRYGEFRAAGNIISEREAAKLWDASERLDVAELQQLAYEYRICCSDDHAWDGVKSFDDRLVCKKVEFMGSSTLVYAFRYKGYDEDWAYSEAAQPYADLVDDSFRWLEWFQKQAAKYYTSSDSSKLAKLNIKSWLCPIFGEE